MNPDTNEDAEPAYDAGSIQVLEGLEAVRVRPSMYIGSTSSRGLHHLVYEVVDNSIDEAMAGECDEITLVILQNGAIRIRDNGRGIPVDMHPQYNRPALEVIMPFIGYFREHIYSCSYIFISFCIVGGGGIQRMGKMREPFRLKVVELFFRHSKAMGISSNLI